MQQDDRHGDRLTIALVRANGIKPKGPPLFKAKIPGAGAICPNNKNRNFAMADDIKTDFRRKAKRTPLQLACPNDNQGKGLPVGKAGKFFGIHTSKARRIGERIQNQGKKAA